VQIIWYLLVGIVIGLIARIFVRGTGGMGLIVTMLIGAVSAVIGGYLWEWLFGDQRGIAWIGSIIVCIIAMVIYRQATAKRAG
jgi:uncharacterized membrane protein YeaQ/YmgE (transglycosylase-associated protein family)